jgi:NAD(P)H-dependent FMN reductase
MISISVIVGSTRQGGFSEKPAQWILQQLHKREGIEGRLIDLRDFLRSHAILCRKASVYGL